MRKLIGVGAVALGVVGALVCVAAVGLGWWTAVTTADRVTRATARMDQGLSEADARLSRVEERLAAVRADLAEARATAEKLAAENPELPRVRTAIDQLIDRLVPAIDRAAALADSLRTVAAGLRTAADVVAQLRGSTEPSGRARDTADVIDRAADALNVPRQRIEAVKSAQAVRLTRGLVELAGEAAAGSEQLADGLASSRRAITSAREQVSEWRDAVAFWAYVAAAAHTLLWLWVGLGQLCLVGWGRRRMANPIPPSVHPATSQPLVGPLQGRDKRNP